jgi:hypothetical protein
MNPIEMCACGMVRSSCEYHKDVDAGVKAPTFNVKDHVDRVIENVADTDLERHVRLLVPREYTPVRRLPIALVSHDDATIMLCPDVTFRPTHIVLSDMVSQCFDLAYWLLCNVGMLATSDPLPLETFSIKYMQDDRLSKINEWQGAPTLTPANRLRMVIRRNEFGQVHPDVKFRGLLWGLATMGA